jgi:hypothetical protein
MTYTRSLTTFPKDFPKIFYLLILFSVAVCGWNHHLCIGPQSAHPARHGESEAVEEFIMRLAGTCATVPLIIKVPYFAVLIVITSVYGTLILYVYTKFNN